MVASNARTKNVMVGADTIDILVMKTWEWDRDGNTWHCGKNAERWVMEDFANLTIVVGEHLAWRGKEAQGDTVMEGLL